MLGARALGHDPAHVVDLASAPEIVHDIVDELDQLDSELAHRHFDALAEIDQLAVNPPPRGAPLVFLDERAVVAPEAEVPFPQAKELDDDGLRERGDGDRGARSGRHIADAEFQRAEHRMRAQIPPDLLAVVDAVQLDEELDVLLVLGPRVEMIRDPGSREPPEHRRAEGFEARIAPNPEG